MTGERPIERECVEGYLFVRRPAAALVLRRAPARGSIWVPVSGKVEPSDRSFEAALRRELAEETGFTDGVAVTDLEWAVPFEIPSGAWWRLHAFAVELPVARPPTLSDEHVEFAWLPPDIARSRLHYGDNREALDRVTALAGWPAPRLP